MTGKETIDSICAYFNDLEDIAVEQHNADLQDISSTDSYSYYGEIRPKYPNPIKLDDCRIQIKYNNFTITIREISSFPAEMIVEYLLSFTSGGNHPDMKGFVHLKKTLYAKLCKKCVELNSSQDVISLIRKCEECAEIVELVYTTDSWYKRY